ncbi:molybdate ABC transporter permease subunit [Heyndrickxia camelliae]|uniref:Molybdenum transport system permease n=1 Tax=Heyndrickxia camelliae TaxID=1707093 RepID=A0A2N3LJS9_9BACI|nr:molybdate ABC transporter permease subunit [Heyndrickxia camelliae]PKR84793.1 molybdate ABC transporter permease subunit [Heyndrickxia camelliae]
MVNDFWSPVRLSIEVAVISGIIVLIVGVCIGAIMANKRFKGKSMIETLFLLPLVLPPSVIGFLLIVAFGKNSPIGRLYDWLFHQSIIFTFGAAVIAAAVVAFPLMYQSAKTGFEAIDLDIVGAAKVDGANRRVIFLFILLPLAYKSIISGAILSFARALGEFGATLMFAGNIPGKTQTLPTAVYLAIDAGNTKLAWAWVGCIIVISFIMLMIINRKSEK